MLQLLDFPPELIDRILLHVDSPRDLISFACASQMCKSYAVPHRYRSIRVTGRSKLGLWGYLASRTDLAKHVRSIRVGTLTSDEPWGGNGQIHISYLGLRPGVLQATGDNILRSLEQMSNLTTFQWALTMEKLCASSQALSLLEVVARRPLLRGLQLSSESLSSAFQEALQDPGHSIWRMKNLEWLELDMLGKPHPVASDANLGGWLRQLPSLTLFSTTSRIFVGQCLNLSFPALKQLAIVTSDKDSQGDIDAIAYFLQNHASIEEFSWVMSPCLPVVLQPGCLPNLKKLACQMPFLEAMEAAFTAQMSSAPPQPPSRYKLEELHIYPAHTWYPSGQDVGKLRSFRFLDGLHLRSLHFTPSGSFSTLCKLSVFPNLEKLEMPSGKLCPSSQPGMSKWVTFLPRFKNLRVLEGYAVWDIDTSQSPWIGADVEAIEYTVQILGRYCPKLKRLSYPKEQVPGKDPLLQIDILRSTMASTSEIISYSVEVLTSRQGPSFRPYPPSWINSAVIVGEQITGNAR
ncbi:hypothetical protein BDN72DRAFT_897879 [Pluteus cervinus]|uniref:Uncharacterized protein n=1 Tax=Pluteus cervinus TaxID=181527 RepID=A0ACD3AT15_9AGAR|nr:hypothetical protein BDN72DRAFT_897879 [Pluteus cervinus]